TTVFAGPALTAVGVPATSTSLFENALEPIAVSPCCQDCAFAPSEVPSITAWVSWPTAVAEDWSTMKSPVEYDPSPAAEADPLDCDAAQIDIAGSCGSIDRDAGGPTRDRDAGLADAIIHDADRFGDRNRAVTPWVE